MSERKTTKGVSGWYARPELTAEEKAAEREAVEKWYEQRIKLNYRSLPVEVPGRMLLELGKLAQARGGTFNDFIEGILAEYLQKQGISWER